MCRGVFPCVYTLLPYPWLITLTSPLTCVLQTKETPLTLAQLNGNAEVVALLQAAAATRR